MTPRGTGPDLTPRGSGGVLSALERGLARVDDVLAVITGWSVLAVMFVIASDVVCRYALGRPIAWVYDLVSIYFINMTLYLIASDTLNRRGHIALDLTVRFLPRRVLDILRGLGWLMVDAVLLLAAWVVAGSALRSLAAREIKPGLYEWPVWLETGIVAFGLALLSVRVTLRLLRYLAAGCDGTVFSEGEGEDPHAAADRR